MTAAEKLAEIAARSDAAIDVAEAALWIAASEYPSLDVSACLERFDALAAAALERVPTDLAADERVALLNQFLFDDCGFRGNDRDYFDPKNSFLNDVLERRTGLPITLSLVYVEIARRIGLEVVGVGFPGHFLVKLERPEILIDAFHGRVVTREECADKLAQSLGEGAALDDEHLRAARPREILCRVLRNLKHLYVNRGDFQRALDTVSQILLFEPDDVGEMRDRGVLYLRLECFGAALRDLEESLARDPDGPAADAIRRSLPDLRRQVAALQ